MNSGMGLLVYRIPFMHPSHIAEILQVALPSRFVCLSFIVTRFCFYASWMRACAGQGIVSLSRIDIKNEKDWSETLASSRYTYVCLFVCLFVCFAFLLLFSLMFDPSLFLFLNSFLFLLRLLFGSSVLLACLFVCLFIYLFGLVLCFQLLRRQAMYNELLTSVLRSHKPLPRGRYKQVLPICDI